MGLFLGLHNSLFSYVSIIIGVTSTRSLHKIEIRKLQRICGLLNRYLVECIRRVLMGFVVLKTLKRKRLNETNRNGFVKVKSPKQFAGSIYTP